MEEALPNPRDKWIPWYFVLFFLVIALIDGLFVFVALRTYPGIVTQQAYEKGLTYNDILEKAQNQPNIYQKPSYENGMLHWVLKEKNGEAISNALIQVKLMRPVQDGYDFDTTLEYKGNGIYETALTLPLQGLWVAKLNGTWDNKQYQTTYEFVTKKN